jgi:acetyl-CoA carboxylase biotin carboxyl carrier protein
MKEWPVTSELNARVWMINIAVGDRVEADDTLMVLESMKTEIPVNAPGPGVVVEILVVSEELVAEGQPLVKLGP